MGHMVEEGIKKNLFKVFSHLCLSRSQDFKKVFNEILTILHTGDKSSRMNSFPSVQQVQSLLTMLPAPLSLLTLTYRCWEAALSKETESRHPAMLGIILVAPPPWQANRGQGLKSLYFFCYLVSSLPTGKSISLQTFFLVLKNRLVHFVWETTLTGNSNTQIL